ncbi:MULTISPECIES: CatB-related O-acetyltransferase [Hyphomicrobiales]|jgi:acetyltransferase-like isoleucine patch superfamily enzyme|uniref:CatB-related O-acetyltransferase n=1 Tax=Hyphomicrobiales TaxID=356 RepID=UPI00035D6EDC|nr:MULTISPECIES: CatB-related O-acetyltransferase [Phyllobacteriaceae]MCX8572866.1 CatB-related O-acetyltransferase [Aminobacter sp. MET-1]
MNHYRAEDEPLTIGSFCSIGPDVAFFAHTDHSIGRTTTAPPHFFGASKSEGIIFKGPIILGNDVWIGQRSMIMPNVRIGDGAVISAGSVVTKDVAPYAVVGGVPATLIKLRFPAEVVRGLLEVRWWDWSHEQLRANRDVLMGRPEALLDRHLPGWRTPPMAAE